MPQHTDELIDHPLVGLPIAELPTPAPLVDLDVLETNIATMAAFFSDRPATLRPHARTRSPPALVRDGERTDMAIGETITIYPGYCCAAANLHDFVYAVRNDQVEAVWRVTARGRSQ